MYDSQTDTIAFAGTDLIARGPLCTVAVAVKQASDEGPAPIVVLDAVTSRTVELDLRGSVDDVIARLPRAEDPDTAPASDDEPARRSPGRPKLGVVGREVTLLPRHWEWLASQPGGASVTLRKLVENARRESAEADRVRTSQEATYRFMLVLAGDVAGFEEATRALYAGDRALFAERVGDWPADVRDHALELAEPALTA